MAWSFLPETVDKFHEFLTAATNSAGPLQDWHVIFDMGTVVRITPADIALDPVVDFGANYVQDFPVDRIDDDKFDLNIIEQNTAVYNAQRDIGDPGVISAAYNALISDGYPYPGGQGSDRAASPLSDPAQDADKNILWGVFWPNRNIMVFNILQQETNSQAVIFGGEMRRLDVMFPRAAYVISPDIVCQKIN